MFTLGHLVGKFSLTVVKVPEKLTCTIYFSILLMSGVRTRNLSKQEASMANKYKKGPLPAILSCPQPLGEEFNNWESKQKMLNILSTINSLCRKVEQHDINLNHDTDSLEVRCDMMLEQTDGACG